ncbi:MAG: helix-turn-helix domain-containing protein [Bacteroidaceae bacterium]|nr:helix-turn-helix domain-containing protein [Bacteroidaceae bacterium]
MELFGQIPIPLTLFFTLYGVTGVVTLIVALYLLLRRGNAIAPGVTPPVRLRRWTASFFTVATLAHVWWLLFFIYSGDLQSVSYLVLVMLDCVSLFITFAGMLLAMLQDRRRSVRPALAAMIPFVALGVAMMANPNKLIEQITAGYLVLLGLAFTVYMVFAIRQYGRWLNDNYADLENKKVWLCQTVALVSMLSFILYVLATDMVFLWLIHFIELVLVGLLIWRVETLPDLENGSLTPDPSFPSEARLPVTFPKERGVYSSSTESSDGKTDNSPLLGRGAVGEAGFLAAYIDLPQIEQLLSERCVATQLYLRQDLSLQQLAQAIGTNRSYLSLYFSRQGITYNIYINNLRINHFITRYQELVRTQQPIVAQQLASESGFRSYSTFSLAFKQRIGQSVTTWMRGTEGDMS